MRSFYGSIAILSLAALSACSPSTTGTSAAIPHLQKQGTATQLIVDGKPFLMLAGELRNSNSSSSEYLKPIWPRMVAMHLNTVLSAVHWELIEPQEGKFDFALVDSQIRDAQTNNLRLIFLWFGSWKNGVSSYIPAWVKTNQDRFPRVPDKDGKGTEILSTLSAANRDADARAFAALMRHIKEVDAQHRVVMIQVENEVGLGGDTRDRSEAANKAFADPCQRSCWIISAPIRIHCIRCSGRRGKRPGPRHRGPGKRFSVKAIIRMRSSWRGTMRATWAEWRRRARPNTRCPCS